jgi:hypothetical protein
MNKARFLNLIHTIREFPPRFKNAFRLLIEDPFGGSTVYHAGHDYSISMQPLDADFDAGGFPVHAPATKLTYTGFVPQYVNYLHSP